MTTWLRVLVLVSLVLAGAPSVQAIEDFKTVTLQNAVGATGNGTAIDVASYTSVALSVTISATATVTFEGTVDGTTWASRACVSIGSTSGTGVTTATATGTYQCSVAGLSQFRARVSSFGSGTITVIARATTAVARLGGGGSSLTMVEGDASPNVSGVTSITVPNGSLTDNGSGSVTFTPAGSGDVTAASAFGTDNRLIRSDGTAKGVQASGVTLDDSDNMSGAGSYAAGTTSATAGLFRSPNNTNGPCWRNAANSANLCIKLNASNEYEFDAPINLTGTAGATLFTGVVSPSAPAGAEQWYFYADSVDNLPKYIYNGESEQTFYTTANPQTTASTASANDNDTSIATTAYVQTELTAYASDTVSLTNKTVDCTTAGNVCTVYKYLQLDLVGVAGGTAGHVWNDDPLSTTCTAASTAGTNQTLAFCTFPDSDGEYGKQLKLSLPTGYVAGSLQYRVSWKTTGTGNLRPRLQTLCYASDAASDTAYSNSTYITAAAGTSGRFNQTAWTTATDTGCDAEETMAIRFSRNRTEASDTLNAAADVEFVGVRYAVAQ